MSVSLAVLSGERSAGRQQYAARFTTRTGVRMNALQQRFAGLWLVVGIGTGISLGVATGFDAVGLALGAVGGIVAGVLGGHRRA